MTLVQSPLKVLLIATFALYDQTLVQAEKACSDARASCSSNTVFGERGARLVQLQSPKLLETQSNAPPPSLAKIIESPHAMPVDNGNHNSEHDFDHVPLSLTPTKVKVRHHRRKKDTQIRPKKRRRHHAQISQLQQQSTMTTLEKIIGSPPAISLASMCLVMSLVSLMSRRFDNELARRDDVLDELEKSMDKEDEISSRLQNLEDIKAEVMRKVQAIEEEKDDLEKRAEAEKAAMKAGADEACEAIIAKIVTLEQELEAAKEHDSIVVELATKAVALAIAKGVHRFSSGNAIMGDQCQIKEMCAEMTASDLVGSMVADWTNEQVEAEATFWIQARKIHYAMCELKEQHALDQARLACNGNTHPCVALMEADVALSKNMHGESSFANPGNSVDAQSSNGRSDDCDVVM